jgi:hypothetical protein
VSRKRDEGDVRWHARRVETTLRDGLRTKIRGIGITMILEMEVSACVRSHNRSHKS